jgi:hypothetical protein
MKFKSRYRSKNLRNLVICVCLLPVFVFVSGCCTCKVEDPGKVLLIVKQADNANPNLYNPEGAKLNFTKLAPGDTLHIINHFGRKVDVEFPSDIIEGELSFTLKKCKERTVTIKSDITTVTPFNVVLDAPNDPGHGGANMIIDPGNP